MDSRILNARQESLALSIPQAVAVVGCGGVGFWTAYQLAMAGVPELWLFDHDVVSETNLNRIPFPWDEIGKLKSQATARMIALARPNCKVTAMGGFDDNTASLIDLHERVQWVVATTDTLRSRQMVKAWADAHYIRYQEAAAEGEDGSATGQPADWSTPEETNPGYASVPVWCGPCVASANIACYHILHDTEMGDRTVRIGWKDGHFEVSDSELTVVVEEDGQTQPETTKEEQDVNCPF